VPGTDTEFTHVATVRDGRIVLNEYFWDHGQALKAVGLSG
jgi:ketosteroid isomerase-like protein